MSVYKVGQVMSHMEMCSIENKMLQHGMHYKINGRHSVILMSTQKNSPYNDVIIDDGKTLIYEGHDIPARGGINAKGTDQQLNNPSGSLTSNGKFYYAALKYKEGKAPVELVKVYEKIKSGIWVYNGVYELIDAQAVKSKSEKRVVYKFTLKLSSSSINSKKVVKTHDVDLEHNRFIPPNVKLAVWKRDKGMCTKCGSKDNLHFDHILPFSKGGTSLMEENIQLLCARHNLKKRDRIE